MTFWTALSSVEVVYLPVLIGTIILQKRSPVATLSWILALSFFPAFGLLVYFVIGPRRLHRKRLRHAKSRRLVRGDKPTKLGVRAHELPWKDQLVTLVTNASGAPLATCREVTVFTSGAACFDAIGEAIAAAKHHVHVEYYIFRDDVTGRRVRDALIERANAGVKVRVLVDALGSPLGYSFLRPLRDAHIEIARFNPLMFGSLRPRINFRTHRKIVVADGAVGFFGGINVGDEYDDRISGDKAFRDTHVRVRGMVVRELQLAFLEDWHYATGITVDKEGLFAPDDETEAELVQVIASGPDQEWEAMQKLFFTAITSAEERVEITTPYFVPDEAITAALVTAAMRGVDVEILLPHRSDSWVVSAAARSYYGELLRAGASIWEYPRMVHAKTMVVDHKLGIAGSANLDNRSFRLNFEIGAAFYDHRAIDALERQFVADKARSSRVTERARARVSFSGRLSEATARLLSPLL